MPSVSPCIYFLVSLSHLSFYCLSSYFSFSFVLTHARARMQTHSHSLTTLVSVQVLWKLLHEADTQNEKVLVFSQSLTMLDVIETVLKKNPVGSQSWKAGHDYYRLDGSKSSKQRQVRWVGCLPRTKETCFKVCELCLARKKRVQCRLSNHHKQITLVYVPWHAQSHSTAHFNCPFDSSLNCPLTAHSRMGHVKCT